jgi:gluconolactonase
VGEYVGRLWHTGARIAMEDADIIRLTLFRTAALAVAFLATLPAMAAQAPASDRQAAAPGADVARDFVGDGVFSSGIEGPATGPGGILYAVSYGRDGTIGRVEAQADGSGRAWLFTTLPAGSTGNGIRFGADGTMYVADYTGHNVLAIDMDTRQARVFAHLGGAFQPNDIALAPDGTLYASDPDWPNNSGQLWRIGADGEVERLETGMGTSNGIEVSPDGRHLYVNESVQRNVWVYDIGADGGVSGKRLLIAFPDHGMDGMRSDADGNLYIARYGAGVVAMVSPQGRLLREVRLRGAKPTNVAFGGVDGRDVYVTLQDRGAIETFRSERPGREYGR